MVTRVGQSRRERLVRSAGQVKEKNSVVPWAVRAEGGCGLWGREESEGPDGVVEE